MMNKLQRFESLGDNCEFAFFLRESGYDEGSLFRWTLIKNYHALLKLIESDFAGLYVYENLTPSWQDMVLDQQYDICFHTEMYSDNKNDSWVWRYSEQENDLIYKKEVEKINYLISKFKKSLVDGNKIFVVKSNGNNLDDIVFALAKEFKKHGNSKILYVKSNVESSASGEIKKVTDNLFIGAIDSFADYSRANEYSREGWQAVIDNAVKIM
ncbi:hypothetical protein PJU52_002049 [Klebsiella michiganensis]|uniref:hypothetical protein n=2 Tax=Klebsiella michiganensis TaxID=1134687 RepID=UPI0022462087|nr:hypothetical protein [Klebsiella michiganensis]MCW9672257.1 hypothetical protein [Klebsiella michiganensis]MDM4165008.1 hypothetical protein [Klebsiella michiganensis]